jgi:hypothetical protein
VNLVSRVKAILLSPRTEWQVVDTEPSTIGNLYTGYIMPLAAIPVIAGFVAVVAFAGIERLPIGTAVTIAVVSYVRSLIGVFVVAFIIDALAPTFGGQKSLVQAHKAIAYAGTAAWIAGVAIIIPIIGMLVMLVGALYSLYLLYLGLPVVMKAPPDKAAGYTVVVIVAAIVVFAILGVITRGFGGYPGYTI